MTTVHELSGLRKNLVELAKRPPTKKIFIGFDGFVDKIKKAVKEKKKLSTVYYREMSDFASRIASAAGKSGQIQMDTLRIKAGGNGPILADTVGKLGVESVCVGSMGYPVKHPVFSKMSCLGKTISVLNPGLTDAIEFNDGKFMFSELQMFDEYDWERVTKNAGTFKIQKAVSSSTIVACVDWANLPHASNIWEGLLNDIIKQTGRKDFFFLFDLCDPSKKSNEEIRDVLDLIGQFSDYGKVTLGLNESEALKIWAALYDDNFQMANAEGKLPSIRTAGEAIFKRTNLATLLIHPIDSCIAFRFNEIIELDGRLVTKPKVLTGGGDNLNAGYCLGLIYELSMPHCLLLGMAASGSYIEKGVSPTLEDLIKYLDVWIGELEEKNKTEKSTELKTPLKIKL